MKCPCRHLWLSLYRYKEDRGNASYAKYTGEFLLGFGVNLVEVDLAVVLSAEFLYYWGNHAAWCAPIGVEVDYCRTLSLEFPLLRFLVVKDHVFKILAGDVLCHILLFFDCRFKYLATATNIEPAEGICKNIGLTCISFWGDVRQ